MKKGQNMSPLSIEMKLKHYTDYRGSALSAVKIKVKVNVGITTIIKISIPSQTFSDLRLYFLRGKLQKIYIAALSQL